MNHHVCIIINNDAYMVVQAVLLSLNLMWNNM